jgi:hypothetical protein
MAAEVIEAILLTLLACVVIAGCGRPSRLADKDLFSFLWERENCDDRS